MRRQWSAVRPASDQGIAVASRHRPRAPRHGRARLEQPFARRITDVAEHDISNIQGTDEPDVALDASNPPTPADRKGERVREAVTSTKGKGKQEKESKKEAWCLGVASPRCWRPGCCIWGQFGASILQVQKTTLGNTSRLSNDFVRPSLSWCLEVASRTSALDGLHCHGSNVRHHHSSVEWPRPAFIFMVFGSGEPAVFARPAVAFQFFTYACQLFRRVIRASVFKSNVLFLFPDIGLLLSHVTSN